MFILRRHRNPGDALVRRSIELNQPVIFAAMNYRLHAFGFLGGKEVKEAGVGNLGLHDRTSILFPMLVDERLILHGH